jgi:hypothetical protein
MNIYSGFLNKITHNLEITIYNKDSNSKGEYVD